MRCATACRPERAIAQVVGRPDHRAARPDHLAVRRRPPRRPGARVDGTPGTAGHRPARHGRRRRPARRQVLWRIDQPSSDGPRPEMFDAEPTPPSPRRAVPDLDLAPPVSAPWCGQPATGVPTRGCGYRCSPVGGRSASAAAARRCRACTYSVSASSTTAVRTSSAASAATPRSWPIASPAVTPRPAPAPTADPGGTRCQSTALPAQLRRRGRRRPCRGGGHRPPAGPLRIARAPPRPRPLRHRHPLHARPDARRRAAAVPVGPAGEGHRGGHAPGAPRHVRYADAVVPVTIKPAHGVDALYAPRRTVLDPILVDAAVAPAPTCGSASPWPTSTATATVPSPASRPDPGRPGVPGPGPDRHRRGRDPFHDRRTGRRAV